MKQRDYRAGWAAYFAGADRDASQNADWLRGWDEAKAHEAAP